MQPDRACVSCVQQRESMVMLIINFLHYYLSQWPPGRADCVDFPLNHCCPRAARVPLAIVAPFMS